MDAGAAGRGGTEDEAASLLLTGGKELADRAAALAARLLFNDAAGEAAASGVKVLRTVEKILSNLLGHPEEPRFRRLRLGVPAVRRLLGGPAADALQLLQSAGFRREPCPALPPVDGSAAGVEDVLAAPRPDPSRVWIVLTAVRFALGAAAGE